MVRSCPGGLLGHCLKTEIDQPLGTWEEGQRDSPPPFLRVGWELKSPPEGGVIQQGLKDMCVQLTPPSPPPISAPPPPSAPLNKETYEAALSCSCSPVAIPSPSASSQGRGGGDSSCPGTSLDRPSLLLFLCLGPGVVSGTGCGAPPTPLGVSVGRHGSGGSMGCQRGSLAGAELPSSAWPLRRREKGGSFFPE